MKIKERIKKQTDYGTIGTLAWKTRKKRMEDFNRFFETSFASMIDRNELPIKILDVGGVPEYWKQLDFIYIDKVTIVSLNVNKMTVPKDFEGKIETVKGTAINMREYKDNSFDLVFSNSVIEHVGCFKEQKKMAEEVKRIAKHGYIQTPNKYFFMEPHFLFPFFQFFPKMIRMKLVCKHELGHFRRANNKTEAKKIVDSVNLLSYRNLRKLFPKAIIDKERWMCLTKSFILKW